MLNFDLLDSGTRRVFDTGAVRDGAIEKERPDLISPFALRRVGEWMRKGALKYGDRNWEKGIPYSILLQSLWRHMLKFACGRTDEDHLAAIIFNAHALIHFQELGRTDLDDLPKYKKSSSDQVLTFANNVIAEQLNHEQLDLFKSEN